MAQSEQILFADIAYVEGRSFLVTITSPLGMWMVSHLEDKSNKSLTTELTRMTDGSKVSR